MSSVLYEKKDRVAYITLNRPEVLNAMDNQTKSRLADLWAELRDDPDVWVCIISGAGGKAFSVGSDVKEMARWYARESGPFYTGPQPLRHGKMEFWKPIIAAIDGWCVGGGLELAMVTDIRIATEHSQFGLMEPKIGGLAGGGGTVRLPNQVPFAVGMEMLLTADNISARRAYEIGLINQVVPSTKELMPAAEAMAKRILANAPIAVWASKEQAYKGFNMPLSVGLTMREVGWLRVATSEDIKEGATAFAEKRKPNWKAK